MNKVSLISYGAVTTNFAQIAVMKRLSEKIKSSELKSGNRLDCYPTVFSDFYQEKFTDCDLDVPNSIEVFAPSDNYPPHIDDGGTSYFIPLEKGNFSIDGISYPIVPFVLYAFEDGKLHNSDFCSIMFK
jgi:hypothetical protein